jgi:hypothetical protein
VVAASPSPPPNATIDSPPPESGLRGEPGSGMSAADAQQSIARGGSLKDRIAALQGLQLDQPGLPGRVPKPWKKKEQPAAEPEPEPVAEEKEKQAENLAITEGTEPEPIVDSIGTSNKGVEEADALPAVKKSPETAAAEPLGEGTSVSEQPENPVVEGGRLPQRIAMPAVPRRAGPPRRKPPTPSPAKEKELVTAIDPESSAAAQDTDNADVRKNDLETGEAVASPDQQKGATLTTVSSSAEQDSQPSLDILEERVGPVSGPPHAKLPDVPYSPTSVSVDPNEEKTPAIMTQHPSAHLHDKKEADIERILTEGDAEVGVSSDHVTEPGVLGLDDSTATRVPEAAIVAEESPTTLAAAPTEEPGRQSSEKTIGECFLFFSDLL